MEIRLLPGATRNTEGSVVLGTELRATEMTTTYNQAMWEWSEPPNLDMLTVRLPAETVL